MEGIVLYNTLGRKSLLDIFIPLPYLLDTTILSGAAISCLLLLIFYYLVRYKRLEAKCRHLIKIYSGFISEIIICESEEELRQVLSQPYVKTINRKWLSKPLARNVLTKELIKIHKGMSGTAAGNIRWLFNYLQLQEPSLLRLASPKWHIKATAIQELAEMNQEKYITKLYRETNNKNIFVRTEAQIAVVKLTGFEGLRFLNVVSHPINQWQQLRLLQQLSLQSNFQWEKVPEWLSSKNDTVTEFALRLIASYQRYEFHDVTINCLEHPSAVVRRQAVQTFKEITLPHTAQVLEHYFLAHKKEDQLLVLAVIKQIGTEDQLEFLTSLLGSTDDDIHYAALHAIQFIRSNHFQTLIKEVA